MLRSKQSVRTNHFCGDRSSRSTTPCRCGYTLIEMLVSIAIMAVMIAMSLPALQQARRSAQTLECRSRLAQLGMALHSYHLTHGSLPSGSVDAKSPAVESPDRSVRGWALGLLPHLGEQNILSRLNPAEGVFSPGNAAVLARTPAGFQCPGSTTNTSIGYAGSYDDQPGLITDTQDGVLYLNRRLHWSDLVDGLHQTLVVGEAVDTRWAIGTYGSLRSVGGGFGETSMTYPPGVDVHSVRTLLEEEREKTRQERKAIEEAFEITRPQSESSDKTEGNMESDLDTETDRDSEAADDVETGTEVDNETPDTEYTPDEMAPLLSEDRTDVPPPPPVMERQLGRTVGFWTAHRDSGHFLFADGSVHLISRTVSAEILQRLAHRHDHRNVGDF